MRKLVFAIIILSLCLLGGRRGADWMTEGVSGGAGAGGGGGGGGITIEATCGESSTSGSDATCSMAVTTDDFIVCTAASENNGSTGGSWTGGTYTMTDQVSTADAAAGNMGIAYTTATSTVTATFVWDDGNNGYHSIQCYAMQGMETTWGGNTALDENESTAQATVTTSKADSLLFGVVSDWNAVDGASRAYTTTPTLTDVRYQHNSCCTTAYHFRSAVDGGLADATGYTLGLTSPTGMAATTGLFEVRVP